jgi:threonine aldolase
MVFFDMTGTGYSPEKLVQEFLDRGIKINSEEDGLMRFVTNYWVSKDDIKYVVDTFKKLVMAAE